MKRGRRFISVLLALAFAVGGSAPVLARTWENLKSERAVESRRIAKESDVEVRAGKGVIIVATSRPVAVKVYTILGQVVSQETLPAGTSCLTVAGHGVYIVKVGDLTCKVAL